MSIKRETFHIEAYVLYCDGCGRQGPWDAHEKSGCADQLEDVGWSHDPDEDKDYCKGCTANRKEEIHGPDSAD